MNILCFQRDETGRIVRYHGSFTPREDLRNKGSVRKAYRSPTRPDVQNRNYVGSASRRESHMENDSSPDRRDANNKIQDSRTGRNALNGSSKARDEDNRTQSLSTGKNVAGLSDTRDHNFVISRSPRHRDNHSKIPSALSATKELPGTKEEQKGSSDTTEDASSRHLSPARRSHLGLSDTRDDNNVISGSPKRDNHSKSHGTSSTRKELPGTKEEQKGSSDTRDDASSRHLSPARRDHHKNRTPRQNMQLSSVRQLNKLDRIESATSYRSIKPHRYEHRSRQDDRNKELLDEIRNLKKQSNDEIRDLKYQLKTNEQKYTQLLKKCNLQIRDLNKAKTDNAKLIANIRSLNDQCRQLKQAKISMTKQLERQSRQSRSVNHLDRIGSGRPLNKRYSRSASAVDRKSLGLHERCISKDDFSGLLHKCDKLVDECGSLKSQLRYHDNVLLKIHRSVSQESLQQGFDPQDDRETVSPGVEQDLRKLETIIGDKNNEIQALRSHLEEQMQLSDEQWKLMQMKEDEMEREKREWQKRLEEAETMILQGDNNLKKEREMHHQELRETQSAGKKNNDKLRTRLEEMTEELRRVSRQQAVDRHTIGMLKEENDSLKDIVHHLRVQLNFSMVSPLQSPLPHKRWIIPLSLYDDEVLITVLDQLIQRLDVNMILHPMKAKDITQQHSGQVIIPVLEESGIGNNIQTTVKRARIGKIAKVDN